MSQHNDKPDDSNDWDYPSEEEYPSEHRSGPFAKNGIRINSPHFWEELKKDRILEEDAFAAYRYGETYEDEKGSIIRYSFDKKVAVVIGNNDPEFAITVYRKRRPSGLWIKLD